MTGNRSIWSRNTNIEWYAQQHRLAVVMASVNNSCYVDMAHGEKYLTFMTEELPKIVTSFFPLSDKKEDTFIAGNSMGGYGALRIGLHCPEKYSYMISLSGAIDLAGYIEDENSAVRSITNMEDVFGELSKVPKSENDNIYMIEKLIKEGVEIPKIYFCCGTEDFLYEQNTGFKAKLDKIGVPYTYREGPGAHDWEYWDREIKEILNWLPLKNDLID